MTPVNHARDDSTANSDTLDAVYGDDNRFRIGGDLYTYDSNDRFLNAGKVVDMAKFEELIGVGLTAGTGQTKTEATVQVVLYDGQSILRWDICARGVQHEPPLLPLDGHGREQGSVLLETGRERTYTSG